MSAPLKIPSGLDKPSAMIGLGLFASILVCVGLAVGFFLILRPWWQSRGAKNWVETPCRILDSEVKSHSDESTTYSIDITYNYRVAGQTYQSNRYDFTAGSDNGYQWRAEAVRNNPAGKQTACYVDPQDPASAVLSRSFASNPIGWAFPGIFSLVGLAMLTPVARGAIRHAKFGESVFELDDAPVPLGGALTGTVALSRMIQPQEGFAVKLACIHRIVTSGGKNENVQEIPLWENSQQVMPDTGSSVPVSFTLPEDGVETSSVSPRDRTFWRLDVRAKVPGVDYAAQFEVPVARAELSAAQKAEARKVSSQETKDYEQYQLPAHSRIRVQDTGGGKEFYFPAMRNVGLAIFLRIFLTGWTALIGFMYYMGAPLIFTLGFGFFEVLIFICWINASFVTTRVLAEGGQITVTNRIFGLGRSHAVLTSDIREIKVGIGATMGSKVYYDVQVVRQNGMPQPVCGGLTDSHEAHWLALEMARCAGVGL